MEIPKELKGKELTDWLVDKKEELARNVVRNPEKLERFLQQWDSQLGLHQYSLNNLILAHFQYPQTSLLAGFKKWLSLGRTVKKGSSAIKILAPLTRKIQDENESDEDAYIITGWRYVNVFDVNQTEGKKLDFGHTDKITGAPNLSFDELIRISPIPVVLEYNGVANGSVNKQRIQIAEKDNQLAAISCFAHELMHYKLNHLDSDLYKDTKECEAELGSYLICSYLGIQHKKAKYYIGYFNRNLDELNVRASKVLSVAESIIRDIKALN